jgi:uncharacterized protein YdcH (DUF465 family)
MTTPPAIGEKRKHNTTGDSPLLTLLKKSKLNMDDNVVKDMPNVDMLIAEMDLQKTPTLGDLVTLLVAIKADTDCSLHAEIKKRDARIDELSEKIDELENTIDRMEQYSRRNTIRISGVRETDTTKTTDIAVSLLKEKMNIHVNQWDIIGCHRLGRVSNPGRPRTIILKFAQYRKKNEVIQSRRHLKGTRIFINDDLTQRRAKMFKQTRYLKKKPRIIKDCWTVNGTIWIKTNEDRTCQIDTLSDLIASYPEVLGQAA